MSYKLICDEPSLETL